MEPHSAAPDAAGSPDKPGDPQSRVGTIVQGEYRIEKLLYEQDLGPVYEAHNARLKRRYAIQFLRKEVSPPLKALVSVRDDLRRARELAPLGLLPTEQLADPQANACFATEILPGETLQQHLLRGPLRAADTLALFGVLCRTVAALHEAGLVHGALRPDHVILVPPDARGPHAGRAMLLGHALHHLHRGHRQSADPAVLRYCAPELAGEPGSGRPRSGSSDGARALVLDGQRSLADQKGDVFALGAMLYHSLTGRPPYPGPGTEEVLMQQRLPLPLLEASAHAGLTEELARPLSVVVAGACAPEPGRRIEDCTELERALQQVARGAGLPWPEEPASRRQVSIVRRLSGLLMPEARPARPARTSRRSNPPLGAPAGPASPSQSDRTRAARSPRSRLGPPTLPGRAVAADVGAPKDPSGPVPEITDPDVLVPAAEEVEEAGAAGEAGAAAGAAGPPIKPTVLLAPVMQRERTMLMRGDDTLRSVRAKDVTQLVVAVQQGRMDPITAVQQVQEGELVDITLRRPGVTGYLLDRPRLLIPLVAVSVAVFVAVLLALFR